MKKLLTILLLLCCGCASQHGFHRAVMLPAIEVHVFSADKPSGWADKHGIGVSGRIIKGAIVPDMNVLAHEILHKLNMVNPEFANPDKEGNN